MKTERLILSFIAVLVGLLVAGIGFYIYQMTSKKPAENTNRLTLTVSPTTTTTTDPYPLTVDSPNDEVVTDKKTVNISGTTGANVLVVISTGTSDQVVKATASGNFTATQTIDSGTSVIRITALFPDGQQRSVIKSVTNSTESF